MKKKDIIKSKLEYTKIIKTSKYKKNQFLIIYYNKRKANNNRYGISIPKKIGHAVIRNKIKRQLKNIIDNNKNYISNYYDYVIIVRKEILKLTYQEKEFQILKLIKKIGE